MISTDHLALFTENDSIADWNINQSVPKNRLEYALPDVYNTPLTSLSNSKKMTSNSSFIFSESTRDNRSRSQSNLSSRQVSQNDSLKNDQLQSPNPNTYLQFHDKTADLNDTNLSNYYASNNDVVVLGDFCQFVGPKPIISCPAEPFTDSNNLKCWNDHIDQLVSENMTSDFQMMENKNLFSISRPCNVLHKDADSPCFVHYFTLYDVQARGYVRSYCLIFHSQDKQKLAKCHSNLSNECFSLTKTFSNENLNQFLQDLHQRKGYLSVVLYCLEIAFSEDERVSENIHKEKVLETLLENFKNCIEIPLDQSSIKDLKRRVNVIDNVTRIVKDYLTMNRQPIPNHPTTEVGKLSTNELCHVLRTSLIAMKPASISKPLRTIYELTNRMEEKVKQSLETIWRIFSRIKICSLYLFDDDPYELLPTSWAPPDRPLDFEIYDRSITPTLQKDSESIDKNESTHYLSVAYFISAISSITHLCDESDDCASESTTSTSLYPTGKRWSVRPSWPLNPIPNHHVLETQLSAPAHFTTLSQNFQTVMALSRDFYCSHLPSASSTSFESVKSTDSFQSAACCGDDPQWSLDYKNERSETMSNLPSFEEEFFSEASETFSERPTSRAAAGTLIKNNSARRLSRKVSTRQKEAYNAYRKINKKGMFLNPLLHRNYVESLREMVNLVGLSISINIIATILSRRRMIFTAQTPQQCEFLIRAVRIFLVPNDAPINSWMKVFPELIELLPYSLVGVRRSEKVTISALPRHLKSFASLYDMKSNSFYGPTYDKGVLHSALTRRKLTLKHTDFLQRLIMGVLDEYIKGVFLMLSVFQDSRKKMPAKKLLRLGYSVHDMLIMENIMNFVLQCFSNEGSILNEFVASSILINSNTNPSNG